MSVEWVTVPDGKREHVGILINHNWQPICGQRSGYYWFPRVAWTWRRRSKHGRCADCLKAAESIAVLATEESR